MVNEGAVQVCVNTFNRLKKIRSGVVYDSITTVVDELLQNCQRTFMVGNIEKPTIDIIIDERAIIVRDNGGGCSDPQSVFEFEVSGWEVTGAFGQGGSESVFQIADRIQISSQDWRATVDVERMLDDGNLTVDVERLPEFFNGYEISITGKKIQEHHKLLESHITKVCRYLDCDCYVNGELLEKKDLQEVNSPFTKKFDNEFYSATFGVQSAFRDVTVFYEKRRVCDVWQPGILGIIELKMGAVNLKAPDRKSIIYDDRYNRFKDQLKKDAKALYLAFVASVDYELFNEFEYGIDQNLQPADYADYLPDYKRHRNQEIGEEELSKEVPSERALIALESAMEINDKNVRSGVSRGSDSYGIPSKVDLKNYKVTPKGQFKQSLGKLFNTVWCEEDRRHELAELISKADDYGLRVIMAHGKLYAKAFNYWGIPHVEDVLEKTAPQYIIGSVGGSYSTGQKYYREYSKKEDRLMRVLNAIEKHYGLEDVFRIADVKQHLTLEHAGETIVDTIVNKSAAPVKDRNKIYLDRASLNLGKVNVASSSASITKFDILIVLLNIQTISSGLAMIIYDTVDKTVEHYSKMEKISKEIALLLATL